MDWSGFGIGDSEVAPRPVAVITLPGDRSPDQPAHQSFYSPTGIGIDSDRLGERAAIASESQLSVVMLYFYGTAQVIQHHGGRTRPCKSVGFRGRVAVGELISNLAH